MSHEISEAAELRQIADQYLLSALFNMNLATVKMEGQSVFFDMSSDDAVSYGNDLLWMADVADGKEGWGS